MCWGNVKAYCVSPLDERLGYLPDSRDCWAACVQREGDRVVAIDVNVAGECYCQTDCTCMREGDGLNGARTYLVTRDSLAELPGPCNEDGRAVGVELRGGKTIRARKGVVSNADLKNTYDLVERGVSQKFDEERDANLKNVKLCKSFVHVHLGVPASAIPEDAPPQWTVVGPSWDGPIDKSGKVVVVSVPSKLDPSLAPEGYHVIHAYGAGNEPYDLWKEFEGKTNSKEYKAFKEERARPIFDAIAKRAPDARKSAVVEQIASPLTHARFLRRHEGNYGPAIAAGSGIEFTTVTTPLPGYYRCGDSTTAGIGVPAVASSGAQCANALLNVFEQLKLNGLIRMP